MGVDSFSFKIYLADDDFDDCQFFTNALEQLCKDAKLMTVQNGLAMLDLLASKPLLPDLIVLDLNMPVMDGYDCIKNIKSNDSYKNIPVVILTTSSYETDMERLRKMGADLFITKPNSFQGLHDIVKQIVNLLGIHVST